MSTARIMVTTDCDRHCPYCCNTPQNPAMHKCTRVPWLQGVPGIYDAYVISGGEPYGSDEQAQWTTSYIRWLRQDRNRPVYLYTSVFHEDIPFSLLDGITYTLHYPLTPVDYDDSWKLQQHMMQLNVYRPDMRLIVNKDIRASRIPHISMAVWDRVSRIRFDPSGKCPLGGGEDLYLIKG